MDRVDRSRKNTGRLVPETRKAIVVAAKYYGLAAEKKNMFASLRSESVFAGTLDFLVEDGYIRQTSELDENTDSRIYSDVCTLCDSVVWEYAGHFRNSTPTEIASWFSDNSPRYHVSKKCAAHFSEKHPDELTLATLKASSQN